MDCPFILKEKYRVLPCHVTVFLSSSSAVTVNKLLPSDIPSRTRRSVSTCTASIMAVLFISWIRIEASRNFSLLLKGCTTEWVSILLLLSLTSFVNGFHSFLISDLKVGLKLILASSVRPSSMDRILISVAGRTCWIYFFHTSRFHGRRCGHEFRRSVRTSDRVS